MKPSGFNIITRSQSQDDPEKFLLYNTFRDHRVLFEDPDLNPKILFAKVAYGLPLTPKEEAAVPTLREMGILLDDGVDEQALFQDWYDTKIRERTDIMQVTILPTMACNLACNYCFENEVREDGVMKPGTTAKAIEYLQRRLAKVRPGRLNLTFFGGEPLLQPETLKRISREIFGTCKSLEVPLEIGMITNGVLLTPEFVDEMVPYGFKWVKITFDGDREAHDKKRIYHNRKGTFDIIYDNLCAIAGKLKIAIGGNFDDENYESLFTLIDRLKTSPFANDIMAARFKPIMAVNANVASRSEGRGASPCETCSFKECQVGGMLSLREKVREAGFPGDDRPDLGPCEYHSRNSFTIGPDGSLYKCPVFAGHRDLIAGDVGCDGYNEEGERQIAAKKWDDACEACSFLPNCAGGCRFSSLNNAGSLEVKSCDIKFLKRETDLFMRREIETLSGGAEGNVSHAA